jgi:hypothetical protein
MMDLGELKKLHKELADSSLLSVYLDGSEHNPAERTAWRRRFETLRDDLLDRLSEREGVDLKGLKRALALVQSEMDHHQGFLPAEGWFLLASPDGLVVNEFLPMSVRDRVAWEQSPVLVPYLPVVQRGFPLSVVVADHETATVHRYREGALTSEAPIELEETFETVPGVGVVKSVRQAAGFRGFPAKDAAQRALEDDRHRMLRSAAESVTHRLGRNEWVALSGPRDVVSAIKDLLPNPVQERTVLVDELRPWTSGTHLLEGARRIVADIQDRKNREMLSEVVEEAHRNGRGALGLRQTKRALDRDAVDMLILSREWCAANPGMAETVLSLAFSGGSDVAQCDGESQALLTEVGEGVAARLRFPIH